VTDTSGGAHGVVAEPLPELRFRLPGTWAQIPLRNEVAAKEAVKALVAKQIGTSDEAATVRDALRRQLMTALTEAIAGNGQSMQIALEIVEGFPLPVSFTVFLPEQAMTPAIGTDAESVMLVLEQGLRSRDDIDEETMERFSTAESEVVRTSRTQVVPTEEGVEDLTVLLVDYWMTIPGTKRFILINFHTALVEAAAELTVLFDSIVKAAYWYASQPEA
jgi:hypothetical protein